MPKKLPKNRVGSIVLPSGETITKKEQAEFKRLVKTANQRRSRWIESYKGNKSEQFKEFSYDEDYLYKKRSASLSGFKSKEEFTNLAKKIETSSDKLAYRGEIYKQNYIEHLRKIGNDDPRTKAIVEKVKRTGRQKFVKLYNSGKVPTLSFLYYDPSGDSDKLSLVEKGLGISSTEPLPLPKSKGKR